MQGNMARGMSGLAVALRLGAGRVRRGSILGVSAAMPLAGISAPPSTPQASSPATVLVGDAEREAFLLEGEVVHDRPAGQGLSGSRRVTLRWRGREHDAHVQTHDEYKSLVRMPSGTELDFRDSWRNNVAAYRLDRLLGLGMVPTTVVRHYRGKSGAYTWWVDDVLMSEKDRFLRKLPAPDPEAWNRQMFVVRLFDQLIYNFDRNLENLLIDTSWRLWMIDHTRAFKVFKDLRDEKNLADTCDRSLLAALRTLDKPTLEKTMADLLNGTQIDGLLARRDKIVRHYDEEIAAQGEAAVLYDLPSPLPPPTRSP